MSKIAVLGLGAMGSRMAKKLIDAGHSLHVWNRSGDAAKPLVKLGAVQAASPREAAREVDFVISMIRDDAVSREVWLDPDRGALAGMKPDSIGIESSTLTPGWIRELGADMQGRGVHLLEAPVSGSRVQADDGQLMYLVGGEALVLQRCLPILLVMGAGIHHVGKLGNGALTKLATNAILGLQVTGLAEVLGLLKRQGVDAEPVLAAMARTSVWAPVSTYLSSAMLTESFAPQFPVELIEKDFGYTLKEADSRQTMPTIAAAHDVFSRAIARGFGSENMTSVVKLFTEQPSWSSLFTIGGEID